jgi:hypothetical protein
MNHNDETGKKTITTLADLDAGSTVRLDDQSVQLDEVEQLGMCDTRGSAAYGLDLTKVTYLRRGKRRERIYPSMTLIERLAS